MADYSYQCRNCSAVFAKEYGQCPSCDDMGGMFRVAHRTSSADPARSREADIDSLDKVTRKSPPRIVTGFQEYDRVLGGGPVLSFVQLWGGPPGIGKSTLFTQVGGLIAAGGNKVLYVCGEENKDRVKQRAARLGVAHANVLVTKECEVGRLTLAMAKHKPLFVIVDSIQTTYCEDIKADPGTTRQIETSTERLKAATDRHKCATVLIGHVDKDGLIAGGRRWQHLVDGIFHFEGDPAESQRLMRSSKNREGSTAEVGVVDMGESGLTAVEDLAALYLQQYDKPTEGVITTLVQMGHRSVPIEIQALVRPPEGEKGRRYVSGYSRSRLEILLATLRYRVKNAPDFSKWDIFLNVMGGIELTERATDLAVVLVVLGSALRIPTSDWCAMGEVALSGHIAQAGSCRHKESAETYDLNSIMPPKGSSLQDLIHERFGSKL